MDDIEISRGEKLQVEHVSHEEASSIDSPLRLPQTRGIDIDTPNFALGLARPSQHESIAVATGHIEESAARVEILLV
jgi:hypothetical protein